MDMMLSCRHGGVEMSAGLTGAQSDAARASGPIVVLAGAGTGKTRTLVAGFVDRIMRRGMRANRILAVTFTNKAAAEMKSRIVEALGSGVAPQWVGTFHAHGRRQLRTDPDIAGLRQGFDVCDAEDSQKIVRRLLEKACAAGVFEVEDSEVFRRRVKSITARIAMLKEELILPDVAAAATEGLIASRKLADPDDIMAWRDAAAVYPAYQALLREANMADFADLLLWPTITMLRDETYRRDWAARFDAVLADEFQDVNRLQFLWLKALSRDHGELFCVGDDAQSIYGWRGANVRIIRNFLKEFPTGRMIALEENFRSTGHILSAANAVIARDPNRLKKELHTAAGDGKPIEIVSWSGSAEEAKGIAAEIGRRALEGVPYSDMAILYRFNFLSRLVEEELLRSKIPYELVNDTAFWQRAVVKDALALLRLSCCPDERQSDEAFRRVVNQPARGIGAKSIARLEQLADDEAVSLFRAAEIWAGSASGKTRERLQAFLSFIRTMEDRAEASENSLSPRIRTLLEDSGYADMHRAAGEDGRAALENLHELLDLAQEFADVQDLFDHASLGSASHGEDTFGRVKLMTIHGAKGLEFGHVFLIGWEDTVFPSRNNSDPDEERRLAYVALTRGRRQVSISWCAFRNGRPADQNCFVDELPEAARHEGWLREVSHNRRFSSGRRSSAAEQNAALGF